MNYILEIKAFHDEVQIKQLSTGQIALWYALMYINNKCAWTEWFTVANRLLESNTGLSRQGVLSARNVLKQYGYIDFKSNGTKATSYKLHSISKFVQDSVQDSVQVSVQDSIQVSVQDSSTLNKQNKTKQNEINTTPLPPSKGEHESVLKSGSNSHSKKDTQKKEIEKMWDERKLEFSPDMINKIQEWLNYKKEIKKEIKTITGFKSFLNIVKKNIDQFGENAVFEIINLSMSNNYQGIVWEKLEREMGKYGVYQKDTRSRCNGDSSKSRESSKEHEGSNKRAIKRGYEFDDDEQYDF